MSKIVKTVGYELCLDNLNAEDIKSIKFRFSDLSFDQDDECGDALYLALTESLNLGSLIEYLVQKKVNCRIFCKMTTSLDNYMFHFPDHVLHVAASLRPGITVSVIFI